MPALPTLQTRPEPMNASPFHSKVKVSLALSDPTFVAGNVVSGKMELECKADIGLGIGIMMVELFAIQELTSRDHSATSTFLHSRRLFQGPGLPPSNAVMPHPIPGEPPLPQHYHQARRGQTTFFFQIPTPATSPSTIDFGNGLACVRYEVKGTVGVAWKGEKKLVTNKKSVDIVESYEEDDFTRIDPEGIVVGENGKIWVQGRVVGGLVVAGESACVELQVKNHSSKRTTGLQLSLTRNLHFPNMPESPLRISDALTTVAFRGSEYIVQPGVEGVASLVFDVPRNARSVKGGARDGDEVEGKVTDCLFEVRCTLGIKIGLPLGSKDILLELPVAILHPLAIPQRPITPERFTPPNLYNAHGYMSPPLSTSPNPYLDRVQRPYAYPALPMSPPLTQQLNQGYVGQGQPWFAYPQSYSPILHRHFSPPLVGQQYYFPPPPPPNFVPPPRPASTEPYASQALHELPSAVPMDQHYHPQHNMLPLDLTSHRPGTPEEGKGERASRIAHHLRLSSRHRSVSPQSHRFLLPAANAVPATMRNLPLPPSYQAPPFTTNLSATRPGEGVVHSPRPMLSPKHSFVIDPITHNALPKSDRVEELERMAEEVDHQKKDLSDDLPKVIGTDIDKTLPSPPRSLLSPPAAANRIRASAVIATNASPSFPAPVKEAPFTPQRSKTLLSPPKSLLSPPAATNRIRANAVIATNASPSFPAPVNQAPPTPLLTAVTPVRIDRYVGCLGKVLGQGKKESGLDALERRLLAEVGTRKMDKDDRHADVRTVLPIAIPTPAVEPLNDSAISSLTLADHDRDSDEKTHHPGNHSSLDEDREMGAPRRKGKLGDDSGQGMERNGERRSGKKKERAKGGEAHKRRKSAKGRVTAWLGAIDPEVPPMDASPSLLPTVSAAAHLRQETSTERAAISVADHPTAEIDSASAPNPRSSGFVPIGTLRNYEERGRSGFKERTHEAVVPTANGDQSSKVDRVVSPPSDVLDISTKNARLMQPPSPPKKAAPTFPPAPAPEVKYDIRSARGGRGGKVAAVASLWAAQASDHADAQNLRDTKPVTVKPVKVPPKLSPSSSSASSPADASLADLTGKRARPIKSQSVPATVSSSLATPMLSSTASLARALPLQDRRKGLITLPPTISELRPEISQHPPKVTTVGSPQTPGRELAFGQARLRDLIKKYQGQAAS